jgi:hypothetical protein
MAVERFRSIEEMNAAPVRVRREEAFERLVRQCTRFRPLSSDHPRGVFKFRSLEEAQAARRKP